MTGQLPATPGETLRVIVGRGGGGRVSIGRGPDAEGGYGSGGCNHDQRGQGGGRSTVQRVNATGQFNDVVTAGGGGAGGGFGVCGGGPHRDGRGT